MSTVTHASLTNARLAVVCSLVVPSETHLIRLLSPFNSRDPRGSVLVELLDLRPELCLHEGEIVHSPDAKNTVTRITRADPIEEGSAGLAEIVGHFIAGCDGLLLRESGHVLLAPLVLQILVVDGEVGSEHGSVKLVTVGTVADKGVEQARSFDRLSWCVSMHRSDEAGVGHTNDN